MKKFKKIRLSYKNRAIIAAASAVLSIISQFLPDDTSLTLFICFIISFLAMVLFFIAFFYKPETPDELLEGNYAKSSTITLSIVFLILIVGGIAFDCIGHPMIELGSRSLSVIASCILFLNCTLLAIFEGKGAADTAEE